MTLDEYQQLAARTIGTRTHADQLSNMALGLAGEAGETADMLKKHLFHGKPLDPDEVMKELGDVMWYVAGMATAMGMSLDDVAQRNVDKLRTRYPDGFSAEASALRRDVVA
ncbi:MAG: nucleoside triphosphate pyrophosphohydrolase family protein [Gemmatimonadaceae bacterium]|nr:nucleoside triphosphate pyrophosphohydrolase family protein [Gemmatimonadaceae bacterium]